eukprot:scaffold6975_cov83-Skeletonema_menzelii.AAC.24
MSSDRTKDMVSRGEEGKVNCSFHACRHVRSIIEFEFRGGRNNNIIMMTSSRHYHWWRLQRRSSEESYSSATSPSKTHRRSSSEIRLSSLGFGSPDTDSDISLKSSPTNADDLLRASWSSGISASSRADMTDRSAESKLTRRKTLGGEEEDRTFCDAFELIRQLSFSPTQKTKKRSNTDETVEASSSFDSTDRHSLGPDPDLDIDLKQPHALRRSSSPLLGLKYLPDEDMFI